MPTIPSYDKDTSISRSDFLLGSDADSLNATKNYDVGDLVDFLITELPPSAGGAVTLQNGANINIAGTGLVSDPYIISVTGIDGSITNLNEGPSINITGTGTALDPYVIGVTGIDGSITNISPGANIDITGSGTVGDPYVITNTQATPTTGQNTLIGRTSSGTGAYESLSPSGVRSLLSVETTTELNTRDTDNRDRSNHTGTQLASTISDLITTVDSRAGYNNTNWDLAADKRITGLAFNSVSGDLEITLSDSSKFTQDLDGRYVESVAVGAGLSVDNTDPQNPIVTYTGGGSPTINNYVNNYFRDVGGSTLVGAVDGVNTSYTTSQAEYNAGELMVFLNGQLFTDGFGISETTPATGVFTFDTAPEATDTIFAFYSVGSVTAGSGTGDLLAANNLSDVSSVATARDNLGLGDLAVLDQITAPVYLVDGVVSNQKLANMAANTIKGRQSTNGVPSDLTPAQVRSLIETETTAQLNARDTANRNRVNHTGTQPISTVTNLSSSLANKLDVTGTAFDSSRLGGQDSSAYARRDTSNTFTNANQFTATVTATAGSGRGYKVKGTNTGNLNLAFLSLHDSLDAEVGLMGYTQTSNQHLYLTSTISGKSLLLKSDGGLEYDGVDLLAGNGVTETTGSASITLAGFPSAPTTACQWVKNGKQVTLSFSFSAINQTSNANIEVIGLPYASDGPGSGESYHSWALQMGTGNSKKIVSSYAEMVGTTLRLYVTSNATANPYQINNEPFGATGSISATISYFTT